MKTRRTLALALVFCMLASCALAGEGNGGFLEDPAAWLNQAWKDASSWASQAWTDAKSWADGAWGDASKWVGQAWNDSSAWVSEIWGDVSAWAGDASGAIGSWWTDTFNTVTKDDTWQWISENGKAVLTQLEQKLQEAFASAKDGFSGADAELKKTWRELLKKLQLEDADASRVMDTVRAYAEEKGISADSLEKILLPYLLKLSEDGASAGNEKMPAVTVAQYLTGIIEKLGITNEEQAQELIGGLDEILGIQ